MKMVKAEGLTYEYTKIMETDHGTEEHKVAALKSVNIEIEKGEFIVVLGHNGSGKSTFAKHINALADLLRLQCQIFFVVKSDLAHGSSPLRLFFLIPYYYTPVTRQEQ